jgi:hypothetical protein
MRGGKFKARSIEHLGCKQVLPKVKLLYALLPQHQAAHGVPGAAQQGCHILAIDTDQTWCVKEARRVGEGGAHHTEGICEDMTAKLCCLFHTLLYLCVML